jgi:hypothetical protein
MFGKIFWVGNMKSQTGIEAMNFQSVGWQTDSSIPTQALSNPCPNTLNVHG